MNSKLLPWLQTFALRISYYMDFLKSLMQRVYNGRN